MTGTALLKSAAGAACVLGVALTLQSGYALGAARQQIRKKIADLAELRDLGGGAARQQAAMAVFDALPLKRPRPISEILSEALPGAQATYHQRDARPADGGWSVRSVEVLFDQVGLADLGRFITQAEAMPEAQGDRRPPWRLAEINITASERTPGTGRVSLILEALEKSRSQ